MKTKRQRRRARYADALQLLGGVALVVIVGERFGWWWSAALAALSVFVLGVLLELAADRDPPAAPTDGRQ